MIAAVYTVVVKSDVASLGVDHNTVNPETGVIKTQTKGVWCNMILTAWHRNKKAYTHLMSCSTKYFLWFFREIKLRKHLLTQEYLFLC